VDTLGVIGNISRDLAIYSGSPGTEMLGGAALHVARAAARAGLPAAPVAVIGTDLDWIMQDARLAGLDLRSVRIAQGRSCEFRLTYGESGDLTGTRASYGAAEHLTGHVLSVIGTHRACHVCCRQPLDTALILDRLVAAGIPFSIDFHLASASAVMPAVRPALPRASTVFVNAAEFTVLAQVTNPATLGRVVISDGPRPATVLRHGRLAASAAPPAVRAVEVTGAGDTLAGTFLAASAQGLDDAAALLAAVSAATESAGRPGLDIREHGG
jgi:sugar/nucleoside kinase (ribokinase family)